jgi:hopene-associated glycosyltransferase HpnB
MIAEWIGALSFLIWIVLFAGWGRFWRILTLPPHLQLPTEQAPRVAVIIPARNEGDVIAAAIQSLLEQDYSGPLRILVADDHSTDDTTGVVARAATGFREPISVISSAPLPDGWTGKMWALAQGTEQAKDFSPEYFLFSDADIVHGPGSVRSLVAMARANDLDLVSVMVKLRCKSFAERALIPAFVFFFFMLYPPRWVNDRRKKTAAAAGGSILVRADALARMGGVATIRSELIDDCALAREIKRKGGIWLGLTEKAWSMRRYEGFGAIGRMISRNAFYQLRHSFWLLMGTLLGIGMTFLAPPIALAFGGRAAVWSGLAWLLMSVSFLPMVRFYRISPLWAVSLPLVALFYAGATVHSAVQYWMGRGGEWKGRVQDAV